MIELKNLKQAEDFLRGIGFRIEEMVIRKVLLTALGQIPGSISDLHEHGKRRDGTYRHPVCGHKTVTKIRRLLKDGVLEPYVNYLRYVTESTPTQAQTDVNDIVKVELGIPDHVKHAIQEWIDQFWVPAVDDLPEAIGDHGQHDEWIGGRQFCWVVPGGIVREDLLSPYSAEIECPIEREPRFEGVWRYIVDKRLQKLHEEWKIIGIEFRFEKMQSFNYLEVALDDQKIRRLRSRLEVLQAELVKGLNAIVVPAL